MACDAALLLKMHTEVDKIISAVSQTPFRPTEIRLMVDKAGNVHGTILLDGGTISNSDITPFSAFESHK